MRIFDTFYIGKSYGIVRHNGCCFISYNFCARNKKVFSRCNTNNKDIGRWDNTVAHPVSYDRVTGVGKISASDTRDVSHEHFNNVKNTLFIFFE